MIAVLLDLLLLAVVLGVSMVDYFVRCYLVTACIDLLCWLRLGDVVLMFCYAFGLVLVMLLLVLLC